AFWKLCDGLPRGRQELKVDWESLQKPGFSADFVERRQGWMSVDFERSDWVPTAAAPALMRNNRPLLAYLWGQPESCTSKDHNFRPGETSDKQLIILNNSRATVACECKWSLGLPRPAAGSKTVSVRTGEQERIPLRFELPETLAAGKYDLDATIAFN